MEYLYKGKEASSATVYYLSIEEIEYLKKLVPTDAGPDSAFRLYQYYNFSQYNEKERFKFMTIAAERGSDVAQQNLAYTYYENGQLDKAYEWALKTKLNGNKQIDTLIKKIKTKIR